MLSATAPGRTVPRPRSAAVVDAVRTGSPDGVRAALETGASVDERDRDGLTPLMVAACHGRADLVGLLLDAGADVYTADAAGGATALHKACQGGDVEVVRALLEAGAFVDAVAAATGHTPLMDAVWFKQPDIVAELLDRGASLNGVTRYGFSFTQHLDFEQGANAVGADRLRAAADLVARRRLADENAVAGHLLMSAVARGAVETVRALLARGAAADARFPIVNGFNDAHTPLLVAARDGHAEIVEVLCAAGADVNATEPTFGAVPLHKATYNGHADIVRILVAQPGIDLDRQGITNGYTPLHDALWHGYADCARVLVEAGARLDVRGHDGKTPLQVARESFGPVLSVVSLITDRL
ncbi:MAG: ankyrin repeat domain-containing protein [Kineosporiaceae bacterium]